MSNSARRPPSESHVAEYDSIHRSAQRRKRSRLFLRGLVGLLVYAFAWQYTIFHAEEWIAKSLHEYYDTGLRPSEHPASIQVSLSRCPAPFVVLATSHISHRPYPHLPDRSETTWFVATPIDVYEIAMVSASMHH